MKTKFLLAIAMFLSVSVKITAQDKIFENLSLAVLGGIHLQDLKDEHLKEGWFGNNLNFGYNGFHVGINIQIPVIPQIFFQPGLLLSQKTANDEESLSPLDYRITYLEIPVNIVYKSSGSDGYFMVGLGPYAGYTMGGKAIFEDNNGTTKSSIEFKNVVHSDVPSGVYYMRPFDAGGNLFFGYEFPEGIFMQLDIQLGIVNIYPEDNRIANKEQTIKNSGFGISAGYRF